MVGFLSCVRRFYLSVYNWTLIFGWLIVLFLAIKTLKESSYEHVYSAVEMPLLISQTAAVMEILHGAVGLVRTPVSASIPQISGRLYVTWVILYSFPQVQNHFLALSLVLSWSFAEITRYSFYGMKEVFGSAPSWLVWLRYSQFMVCYPIGLCSEVGLINRALPYIKEAEKYCIRMPNKWNFSFNDFYFAVLTLGLYVLGFPKLFSYMVGQRKKALSKSKRE